MADRYNHKPGRRLAWLEQHALSAKTDECTHFPFSGVNGYGKVNVKGRQYLAHRYVCERAHGPAPSSEHEVAHNCGQRRCVNPCHLRWATRKENHADKVGHGTTLRGTASPSHKLTDSDVLAIRGSTSLQREDATAFGVSRQTIGAIRTGTKRAWMPDSVRSKSQRSGAKLTELLVVEIREKYATGNLSMRALAAEYGVTPMTVHGAVHRKTWKGVKPRSLEEQADDDALAAKAEQSLIAAE